MVCNNKHIDIIEILSVYFWINNNNIISFEDLDLLINYVRENINDNSKHNNYLIADKDDIQNLSNYKELKISNKGIKYNKDKDILVKYLKGLNVQLFSALYFTINDFNKKIIIDDRFNYQK